MRGRVVPALVRGRLVPALVHVHDRRQLLQCHPARHLPGILYQAHDCWIVRYHWVSHKPLDSVTLMYRDKGRIYSGAAHSLRWWACRMLGQLSAGKK